MLAALNFLVLQWFFVRLERTRRLQVVREDLLGEALFFLRVIESHERTHREVVVWKWRWTWPLTGWWSPLRLIDFGGGGEQVTRQPLPRATQQGAATPGQSASSAAGNVAEPQLGPTPDRAEHPPSPLSPPESDNAKR